MKEKIELFAKGVFTYEKPELNLSVSSINISAELGKVSEGSFVISSSSKKAFKGIVYSTDPLLTIDAGSFYGITNEIRYSFDATYLDMNDSIKGRICIVSEYGGTDIPFHAKVKVPSCETSVGPASDLFHFANLAQSNWSEAKSLFKSEEFRHTLSFYAPKFDTLLRTLASAGNISLALEEFLTTTRKKKKVEISTDTRSFNYECPKEIFTDTITIHKDTWGYSQLSVETEGSFVTVGRKIIWSDDFAGNTYIMTFAVDPQQLHAGYNYGLIRIGSVNQKLEIPIVVHNSCSDSGIKGINCKIRRLEARLLESLEDYLAQRSTVSQFASETARCIENLKVLRPGNLSDRLFEIYVQIESGREAQALSALSVIYEDEEWEDDLWMYAAALYLKGRLLRNNSGNDIFLKLREIYDNCKDAKVWLLCIGLDRKLRLSNQAKYEGFRRSDSGQTSPLVLYEACRLINEEPTVLRELEGFDLRALAYGVRNKMMNRNAMLQVAYLAIRQKETSFLQMEVLAKAAESTHLNELLEALCRHIVKSGRKDELAYKWLLIGINEQVNVKNIYESCLLAAGDKPDKPFPKQMLAYFEGGIELDDDARAAFYAGVLRNRNQAEPLSQLLTKQMKGFALDKLAEGTVDENLAVIYNNIIEYSDLTGREAARLPEVIFKHVIPITWHGASQVRVTHKELAVPLIFPTLKDKAYIDIYTEEAVILAADEHGNMIVLDSEEAVRLVTNPDIIRYCQDMNPEDNRVALSNLDNVRYRGDDDEAIELLKTCLKSEGLDKRFEIECRRELIEYYYENVEGDLMEALLVQMDLSLLSRHDRCRMVDLLIMRELYSLAMKNMELYGIYGVEPKRLAKLAAKMIISQDERVGTELFTDICYLIFKKKKYDANILKYLVKYYNGDSEDMYLIWRTAADEGISPDELEERLLCQILFSENDMTYAREIFESYYTHFTNRRLVRAFISYYSYKYLVHEVHPEAKMLDIMRRETMYEENDICVLALLKSMTGQKKYSDDDISFIGHHIENLEQRGIVMPFFKNFPSGIRIPESMRDKYYIEYHTDPHKRVRIHYCWGEADEHSTFTDVEMKDVGYGIFVSEFVLFYGEVLQYYISEEDEDNYLITESSEITLEPELIGTEETGFHQLNLIITAREMNDGKTMQKLLETYVKNEYLCRRLFNPIYPEQKP